MPIHVDAYTAEGVASGVLARSGYLRDALEVAGDLPLERVAGWPMVRRPRVLRVP
jgi:hypothetical protein